MHTYRGWRATQARRMLRKRAVTADRRGRCRLYALDGKAWLVSKRRVALLADWFEFQHRKRDVQRLH